MAGSRSGSAPKTAAAADGWHKDAIPEDALPKGSLPEDSLPKDALPEDALPDGPVAEASPRGGRRVRVVASELRDVGVSVSCRV